MLLDLAQGVLEKCVGHRALQTACQWAMPSLAANGSPVIYGYRSQNSINLFGQECVGRELACGCLMKIF